MTDDKVVPLHGGVVLPHEPTDDMRQAVKHLSDAVERMEFTSYAIVGLRPDGSAWHRWHAPGEKVFAVIGALTVTANAVAKESME